MDALPIDVILPARNEEATLGAVLSEIAKQRVRRVLVADNGSADDTARVARAHGAEVIDAPKEGYGNASLAALAALAVEPSVVVWLVADGSDDPSEIDRVAGPVARGECDLVIGSRMLGTIDRGAMTATQRYGSAFAAAVLRARFGVRATDLGPFRAIERRALHALAMRDTTWGWTIEMQVKAARAGLRTREVPVSWRRRAGGEPKVAGTLKGTIGASRKILSWMAGAVLGERFDPVR